ncbi:hypothetical protein BN13_820006 [Nostocoides jenkinsii Ben 74]|uniref:Uncharacterized protein n=1 Tax=Nostocoides jenkinsii Ben 74 TaxID=1193518 RepID=A0A077MFC9_9MICO|nr:hypothetical protein BN13_820006 [Tetrasphaera jenkinsii Ben 74]
MHGETTARKPPKAPGNGIGRESGSNPRGTAAGAGSVLSTRGARLALDHARVHLCLLARPQGAW